jgi:outer membrane cobalamin receptor
MGSISQRLTGRGLLAAGAWVCVAAVAWESAAGAESDTLRQTARADSVIDKQTEEAPIASAKAVAAQADSSRGSVVELEKTVVTATRTRRRASEMPVSVTVVGRAEIESAPARNIDDLLQTKAGVLTTRAVGMGEGVPSDIVIRGVPGGLVATRTLILVDGIPTNATGTPFLIVNEIPLQAVSRLEIVRGPFSCLYGANALGGVLNVLTRDGDGPPSADVIGEIGPYGYYNLGVWSGAGSDRIGYSISAGIRRVDNYLGRDFVIARNGRDTTHSTNIDNFGYYDGRMFGRARIRLGGNLSLTIHGRFFDSELGFGKTRRDTLNPLDSVSDDVTTYGRKYLVGPEFNWQPSPVLSIRAAGFYRSVQGTFESEDYAYTDTARDGSDRTVDVYQESVWSSITQDWQGEIQATVKIGSSHIVTVGGDVLRNAIDFGATRQRWTGEVFPGRQGLSTGIYNGGVYVQDEVRLGDRLMAVPGVRADYQSEFGWAVSPKLAAALKFCKELTLRMSGGKGFRAPTLSELYMPTLTISPDLSLVCNPSLSPETIWALDGGADARLWGRWRVQCSGFYNRLHDLIIPRLVNVDSLVLGKTTLVTYRNVAQGWSAGLELETSVDILDWLRVEGSYTFQQSLDEFLGVALDYVPPHKAGLDIVVDKHLGRFRVSGSLTAAYVSRRMYHDWQASQDHWETKGSPGIIAANNLDSIKPQESPLPPYTLIGLSLRLGYRDRFWIGGEVQNLTNASYFESGNMLAPGRMLALKAGCRI